jgi:hypothetical protein
MLNLATAVCLAQCLAAAALWVRSYSWWDDGHLVISGRDVALWSGRGLVGVKVRWMDGLQFAPDLRYNAFRLPVHLSNSPALFSPDEELALGRFGFGQGGSIVGIRWFSQDESTGMSLRPFLEIKEHSFIIAASLWALCAIFATLPAFVAARLLLRRNPIGHCHRCGYDLRATPERCPECGTLPKRSTTDFR